jgi:hypothetical protein
MGRQCLHVIARFATFAAKTKGQGKRPRLTAETNSYDFDPTTSPKKSGKTPVKSKKTAVFAAG